MKRASISTLLVVITLSACSQPSIVVTNQETGVSGRGTATGANSSSLGEIEIIVDNTQYNGTWAAMRDSGSVPLSLWSAGPKDSGVGVATLTSAGGKRMRCEFGYSLASYSGIGLCRSSNGSMYDLFISLI